MTTERDSIEWHTVRFTPDPIPPSVAATIALAAAGIYSPRPLMPRQVVSGVCTCPECGKAFRGRIARSQHLQDAHGYSKSRSKDRP